MKRYLIVGGVAAGATAAARCAVSMNMLKVLIERGPNVSYANRGRHIGGEIA